MEPFSLTLWLKAGLGPNSLVMDNELIDDDLVIQIKRKASHHKNQISTYCYCAKCKGKVLQKPRTIDDHRTRYPNQECAQLDTCDSHRPASLGQSPPEFLDDPPTYFNEPHVAADQHILIDDDIALGDLAELGGDTLGRPEHANPLQTVQEHSDLPLSEVELDNGNQPLDAAPELYREYPFDELIYNSRQEFRLFDHTFAWNGFTDNDFEENDGLGTNDILYDEDFGLPDSESQHPHRDTDQYSFQPEEELEAMLHHTSLDSQDHEVHCAAFEEPELIRNAYIDVFIQKSLYGATHRAIKHQLRAARRALATHPSIHPENIAKMAQTIGTVEKRLGVNSDSLITIFTLCPTCRRLYTREYIDGADDSRCLNEGCSGILFIVRKLASGAQRRVSTVTYPFASPIAWIRHMLNLPGMAEMIQHWRTEDSDNEGLQPPVPSERWIQAINPSKPIGDMCDAWGWRSTEAGLERYADPRTGNVIDASPLDPPVRFTSLPFGISLSLNTDWFQATKEGNYSVGACYLAINNLPRHMRFLRENISLCLLMPGPNEPNDYALDQMLGPLINELLELKQGVRMIVRKGDPPVYEEEIVHGDLTQHIADLIARIKMGGGAGLRSELNFCLHCHTRLSSLSVPAGYMRQNFVFRDPQEDLNNAYHWKSLETAEERKAHFARTGNRFTALHYIPGAMNWIVKQVLVAPGMFAKRRPEDIDPQSLFNDCLDQMWMPKNFQRLPPKLGQTRTSIKADQWKLASRILYVPLFLAFRDGDEISPTYVYRGNRGSPAAKHQAHRAKLLHQQRMKYFQAIGRPDACPSVEESVNIIDKRTITPNEIGFAQNLLESLCIDYTQNGVPLPPNFHFMMHLEEFMLKYGSVYNMHVWGMERANGIVSRINHSGQGSGVLEGTLMRGWWSYSAIQNLASLRRFINSLKALPNRTPVDDDMIHELMEALRGGTEQAHQRGTLMAFIAQCQTAYTRMYGIHESTRLSTQSRLIDLEKHHLYDLVLKFCITKWPDAGIFGPGVVRQCYLSPTGMVRNHSYVEYDGIRYGAWEHTSGKGYCYGYIDGRQAVRIDRILHIKFPGVPNMSCVCALVRLFQTPPIEGSFPWDAWAGHLGVHNWAYGQLGELVAISATRFSGTLALFDIPMSYGRYWVTIALDSVSAERGEYEDEE
ncbi:Transposase family Tnp2 protein [Ceratobasidium sp. AG-Ba]|nr:Transposase family Tnp2 protein [Ceratobasidium sp. AG-Ba]